jgi:peptide/nickel transport system permease protein
MEKRAEADTPIGLLRGSALAEGHARTTSMKRVAFRRFVLNKAALVGSAYLVVVVLCAVLAPAIAPYDPVKMYPAERLTGPSLAHWLGTDLYGRDILSRLLYGSRLSIQVGLIAVAIGAFLGTVIGLVGGYYGGVADEVTMRLMDVMLAFPGILLALTIVAFLGSSLTNVMIAVGVSSVPSFARIVRGCVLSAKENVYVDAAEAIGCGHLRIVFRHILPNVVAPLIVVSTLGVAWAILNGAALSFLGLGAQPPTPEWGTMLSEGRDYLRVAPWISTFSGLAIMMLVITVNVIGDGLRVALDPRMKI